MWGGGEIGDEYGSNGAGAVCDLQGSCSYGTYVWEREIGGDRRHI